MCYNRIYINHMNDKKIFDQDVEDSRIIAAMGYLWILFLIPLLLKRKSKFAQFHAKQAMILFGLEVLLSLFMWVPVISQVLFVIVIIIAAVGLIKAYNGEWWKGPFIHAWSEKINF